MKYTLPLLPYDFDALEPHIDAQTMQLHHDKHHQTYIDKLNEALEDHDDLNSKSVEDLLRDIQKVPDPIRQAVINHGGGHANHSFFWNSMSPDATPEPSGKLADAINETFESFENFKKLFEEKALGVFGSGWAWLLLNKDKKLILKRHSFQNSPLMQGNNPIIGIDVWEHAYYLKYKNKRADYINAWWNVINWKHAEEMFNNAA